MKSRTWLWMLCIGLAAGVILSASCKTSTPSPTPTKPAVTQPAAPKTGAPSPTAQASPAPKTTAAPSPTAKPAAGAIKWRFQAGLTATSFGYLYMYKPFTEYVNSKSNGRLSIELFAPDAIVVAMEQFGAVQKGVIEAAGGMGGYNVKSVPEGDIEQGLPGTFTRIEDVPDFWLKYKDGAFYKLLDEAYREKGGHLLQASGSYDNVLITRQPITTIDAIKGKKMRASGTFLDLMKNLGAAPVSLTPAEVYMALQTGTIDGLAFPDYTIGTMKLWDSGKGILTPAVGISTVTMYTSAKAYDSLPKDLQALVDEAALFANDSYVKVIREKVGSLLKEAQEKNNVKINRMPDADIVKVQKAAEPILDKAAAMNPRSAKLIALIKEYVASKTK